jgi:hypothetical protein
VPRICHYLFGLTTLGAASLACSSNGPSPSSSTGSAPSGTPGGTPSGSSESGTTSGQLSSGATGGSAASGSAAGGSSETSGANGSTSGSSSAGTSSSAGSSGSAATSGSSSGTETVAVDGGAQDSSSKGAASDEAGAGCGASGTQICDDFEGVAAGATGSVWTIDNDGYTVETVTTMAHSGTHSVHVMAKGISGHGYIVETKTFPATDFWGRAYLLLQAPPSGHEVFVAFDGANDEQVRLLNDLGSGKIATNRRSDDQSRQSSQAYPMGTWACYEWHETPTELHVYFQGKELTDADEMWTEATLNLLRLGFERFDTGTGGDIYIDDVAVGSSQIGCN